MDVLADWNAGLVCLFVWCFFGVSVCEEEPRWPFNEPCLEFPTLEKQQSFEALWSWLRLFLLWFYPCQSPSHTKQFEICVKRGNCQLPSELLICPILHMMYTVQLYIQVLLVKSSLWQHQTTVAYQNMSIVKLIPMGGSLTRHNSFIF